MEAGHELDALVAEKVMGYTVLDGDCAGTCVRTVNATTSQQIMLPPYSTDIAAAWQVVEKLTPPVNCQTGTIGECELLISDKYYQVRFEGQPHFTGADTMPLAICLAALKAVP
jgi:hypothetical protein